MTLANTLFALAMPSFLALLVVGQVRSAARRDGRYDLSDTVTSLGAAVLYQATGGLTHFFRIGIYTLVFEAIAPWRWPTDNAWAWVLGLLAYDFTYYWQHRAGHTVALLWGSHGVHHSSERYNLATALRLPVTMSLWTWLFAIPLALLGMPPAVFVVATLVNLLYQFWIHTEAIGPLGWFDRWFGSPSNHRVHHGANARYVDKNFGGVLMVWDRLFGTFEEESAQEKVVFGLKAPVRVRDPVHLNFALWGPRRARPAAPPASRHDAYAMAQLVMLLCLNVAAVARSGTHQPASVGLGVAGFFVVSAWLVCRPALRGAGAWSVEGLRLVALAGAAVWLFDAAPALAVVTLAWSAGSAAALTWLRASPE